MNSGIDILNLNWNDYNPKNYNETITKYYEKCKKNNTTSVDKEIKSPYNSKNKKKNES